MYLIVANIVKSVIYFSCPATNNGPIDTKYVQSEK